MAEDEVEINIWVDFMTMSIDLRLWTRLKDVRPGFVTITDKCATR